MTIGELEKAAGVTDRNAFWARFSHIRGTARQGQRVISLGLEAGIAELRRMIAARAA